MLGHLAWLLLEVGGRTGTQLFDNIAMGFASTAAGVFALRTSRRLYGRGRRAWTMMGLACLSWAAGQLVWTGYEHVLRTPSPYPSLADVGYFGFIPLAVVAIFLFRPAAISSLAAARDILDGVIASMALVYIVWPLVLAPLYADASLSSVEKILSLAYPIGELTVLTAALLLAQRIGQGVRRPYFLLCLGVLALTVAHLFYALLIIDGRYYTGHVLDIGWFSGFLLIALAAHHVRPALIPTVSANPRFAFLALLPYIPVFLMLVATVVFDIDTGGQDPVLEWSAAMVLLAVLARQALAVFENRILSQRLGISLADVQNADGQRKQLLNNIAHDLNGPLTPIRIQTHLLRNHDPALPEDVIRGVDVMQRSVEQLERLVADLADLAKLDIGKLRLDRNPIDLAELVRGLGQSFTAVAATRDVRLHIEAPGPLPILGDTTRLNQVLTNLLGNALKFTPPQGSILLAAYGTGTHCNVAVRDTGRGLTPAQMARMFQPFVQVHDTTALKAGGSGLGLFISRGIVEAHGGHLWVESPGPGAGTTFSVAVPRDTARN
jgi:signal transduction histidine kinase